MLLGIKKTPAVEQLLFKDADAIAANGYLPGPLPWGHSQPLCATAMGAHYVFHRGLQDENGDAGISILTGMGVNAGFDFDAARTSWLVAVQVIAASKKIGNAIDALMSARFAKRPAVRHTTGTQDRLFVFGLDDSEGRPFSLCRSTRRFMLPKDRGTDSYHYCDVISAGGHFAHSGLCTERSIAGYAPDGPAFYWPEGDLTKIPRSELPTIDADGAATLQDDIETVFETHGAERVS